MKIHERIGRIVLVSQRDFNRCAAGRRMQFKQFAAVRIGEMRCIDLELLQNMGGDQCAVCAAQPAKVD